MSETSKLKITPEKARLVLEHEHHRPLIACHWDRSGRYIFFGAEDHLVHRFEVASGAVASLSAHDSWVRALDSSPDGELLCSGGYDGRLVWWPAAADKPEPIRVVEAHKGWIRALAVSPDGLHVATCGNDLLVNLWDAAEGKKIHSFSGHSSHVYHLGFAPDGESLVSCDLHGTVKAWNVKSGGLQRELSTAKALHHYDKKFLADIGGARCIAFRSDGKQLALGGITNVTNAFAGVGEVAIVVMDVESGEVAIQLQTKAKIRGTAWGVAHHDEGFWIGVTGGGGGGWLCSWKGDVAEEASSIKLKSDGRGMSVSPDGTQVAVAHADKRLRIYALHEAPA